MKKVLSVILAVIMTFSLVALVYSESNNEKQNVDTTEETVKSHEIIELSLEDAIDYALENNRDMKIQELNVDKANEIKKQKKSDMEKIPDMTLEKKMEELGVTEKQIELSYQIDEWNKEIAINQIKYNVEKAYYDLKLIEKQKMIAKENLDLAQEQYKQGQNKYKLGTISEQQLLSIKLDLSEAQSTFDSLNTSYELQKMSFNNTLGLPLDQDITLTDEFEMKEREKIDIQDSIKEALENNVFLKIAEENYEISQLSLEAISARYTENTYKYKEYQILVEQSLKNLESAKAAVEMSVRAAYLKLLNSEKQISTFEEAVKNAEKSYDLAKLSFELGESISNDVTRARIGLMNTKTNLSKQIYDYNMSLLDFKYSLGIGKELYR